MSHATEGEREVRRRLQKHAMWIVSLYVLLTVACVAVPRRQLVPQQWSADRGPVVPHDNFPSDCSLCHEPGGWDRIRADFQFDHGRETGVELSGAHRDAQCLRCHNDRGPVGTFARRGCAGCHEDVHRGQLGRQCSQCHGENDWLPHGQFAMHNSTRFPLVGAHTAVACFRCHPGAQVGNFSRAPVRCRACHKRDLARAASPDHSAAGFPQTCETCHDMNSWQGASFNHTFRIASGPHRRYGCAECHHVTSNYRIVSCTHCHQHRQSRMDSVHASEPGYLWTNSACVGCHPTGR